MFTLIRHGETFDNLNDKVSGGGSNPALTELGIAQALEKGDSLQGTVDVTYSSLLERCLVTGQIVFGCAIPEDNRFDAIGERKFGRFESGPNDDWKAYLASLGSGYNDLPEQDQWDYEFEPGIENVRDVMTRSLGVLSLIATRLDRGQTAGVSTSGGFIRGVLLSIGKNVPTGAIDNLATVTLARDGYGLHLDSASGVHFAG